MSTQRKTKEVGMAVRPEASKSRGKKPGGTPVYATPAEIAGDSVAAPEREPLGKIYTVD